MDAIHEDPGPLWDTINHLLDTTQDTEKRLKRLRARVGRLEEEVQAQAQAMAKGISYQNDQAVLETRLARLARAVKALAQRVKTLEEALEAQAQAQKEAQARDRAHRLEMAKAELEALTPRLFAKRGGDADVIVAADRMRALLAQGRLEEAEGVLARWKAEVGEGR